MRASQRASGSSSGATGLGLLGALGGALPALVAPSAAPDDSDSAMKYSTKQSSLFSLGGDLHGGRGGILPGMLPGGRDGGGAAALYAQRRCALAAGSVVLLLGALFVLRGVAASVMGGGDALAGEGSLLGGSGGLGGANLRMDRFPDRFRIAVIADLDKDSKMEGGKTWRSKYMTGTLKRNEGGGGGEAASQYEVKWDAPADVSTSHNEAGRGCELSELVHFNGALLTFDDRTGIMFEVRNFERSDAAAAAAAPLLVPRHIFMEGNGEVNDKGLKVEWSTVKDGVLYVGSFGKEYTNSKGETLHKNNLWVKTLSKDGIVHHVDWTENYDRMRRALGYDSPGYLLHESVTWSPHHRKWFVLPRRMSKEQYEEEADERMGANTIIVASHDFSEIRSFEVGPKTPERGFSSAKFLPGSRDSVLIVLKSEEFAATGVQKTYVAIYGEEPGGVWRELLRETELPLAAKFEGIEVLS
jgi:soluble calcium-activated nucleotidase 1